MIRDGGEAWRSLRVMAAGAMSVPVVVGFVALGAAVLLVRSARDVARETWARLPGRRPSPRPPGETDSDAA